MTTQLPLDRTCQRCHTRMFGVNNYELRTTCEDCGGNRTEYNRNRPHPESSLGRQLAKEAKEAKEAKRNG